LYIEDEHDLEDLVRSLLPLFFDDVRLRSRNPSYAAEPRTDFLLCPEAIALVVKLARAIRRPELESQFREDLDFYRSVRECRQVWIYVFDPEHLVHDADDLERMWSVPEEGLESRCVVSG